MTTADASRRANTRNFAAYHHLVRRATARDATRGATHAALSAVLLSALLAVLVSALLAGCSLVGLSPPDAAPASTAAPSSATSTVDADQARREAVAALVAQRAQALQSRDKRAWLDTVSDLTDPFATAQAAVFDRMVRLPVGDYRQQGVEVGAPLDSAQRARYGADAWVASVHLTYRFTGYDRAPRAVDTAYVVARTPAGWRLAAVASPGPAQPWDLSPLSVVRSASTLVVGDVPVATLRSYLALGDAAHGSISGVWGSAVAGVIVAPRTTSELVSQLQRPSAEGLDQVAAVTDGPLAPGERATSDRVYVNPVAFGSLNPDGRRVVITHELTHVTVRATTTRAVPTWLSEGFADWVGYRTITLGPQAIAAELLTKVRAGSGPTRLPTDGDFDPARGVIAPVYNAAWLAVTRLAQEHGSAKLVAFYRAVAGGLVVDDATAAAPAAVTAKAFPAVLGVGEAAFTADWLAYLKRLAG